MENVILIIEGKEIEMPPIKARLWAKIMKFNEERDELLTIDAVDEYCEIIALAFGVTKDEVLDNLNLEDVVPKYFEIFNAVVKTLFAKVKKNTAEIPE